MKHIIDRAIEFLEIGYIHLREFDVDRGHELLQVRDGVHVTCFVKSMNASTLRSPRA